MAVKDFIPVENVKLTIEKEVRAKPSLNELTTIDEPGIFGAENLEKDSKVVKKKRTKKKSLGEASEVSLKKNSILIITEKPQAAQKIASALGNARKLSEGTVSYYEVERNGEKIVVASAVGHLFNLTYVKGQKGYPIFDIEWQPSFEKKASAFTKKYYNVLLKLSRQAKSFIVATDYDIEGEVIGWNVLRFICKQFTAERMKYSALTKKDIEESFDNRMKELDWGQAYAGEARHYLDWLYGINLSRALMEAIKKAGSFKILSIGRVQGPALKIIVDREREIEKFKPEPYWQIFIEVDGQQLKYTKDIFDKKELENFKDLKNGIAKTTDSKENVEPPTPFDLTTLQREAYKHLRLSPSQTLSIAQKLYLEGMISYPRTSSQKIPENIEPKKILDKLKKSFKEVSFISRKKPFEGKKSDPAHPSIYPTGELGKVQEDELKLYNLIVKRFISVFCSDASFDNTRVVVDSKGYKFSANGSKVTEKGWMNVYPSSHEESEVKRLDGNVKIDKTDFVEKETTPPNRFTPTSLVTLLEKKGLGTKTTRSLIIDTLFDRGYLDGKSIKATHLGLKLIESLEKYAPIIIDENLTRTLEEQMEKILEAKGDFKEKEEKVIESAKKLILDISKEFKSKENDIGKDLINGIEIQRKEQAEENILMKCPVCNEGMLKISYSPKLRRQFVACNKYPDCKTTFSLPPNGYIKNTGKKTERGLPLLLAIRKGKRPWEFEFNPNWKEEQQKESKNL
jgi:DNA topoisomerase-1